MRALCYGTSFRNMVTRWRADAKMPTLPFLTFQLNQCRLPATPEIDQNWARIREAQRQAAQELDHCFVVPTSDIPLSDQIHNSAAGNCILGERMARAALANLYRDGTHFAAPTIHQIRQTKPNCLQLIFQDQRGMLFALGNSPCDLEFTVEDCLGEIPVVNYCFDATGNYLQLSRTVSGACYVSCGINRSIRRCIPLDLATYLPILCFYRFPVDLLP